MSLIPDQSLIARVRRAEINFELLVDVLSNPGYVTDGGTQAGLGFVRSSMGKVNQDDFDALFKVLMPGQLNDIKLRTHATDKGGVQGAFINVLFNENVISYEDMKERLVEINRKESQQP